MNNLLRLTLLLILLPLLPPGAQAQAGPDVFVPGLLPPAPPIFAQGRWAPAGATLAAGQSCPEALADPNVRDTPTSWKQLPSGVAATLDTAVYNSAPQSLKLQAGGGATAAVGQAARTIDPAAFAIYGSLWFRYAAGAAQAGDKLTVDLYPDGSSSLPLLTVDAFDLAKTDGGWYALTWEITDTAKMASLRALGSVTFQVAMRNSAGGATRQLWLDDLSMEVCLPSITGVVRATQGGPGLEGAQVLLAKNTAAGRTIVASATSDVSGGYSFNGQPTLGSGETYQAWFVNAPTGTSRPDTRLGFWAGPQVSASQFVPQPTLTLSDMIVGDVALGGPASYSEVVATDISPVTLSWTKRGVTDETYQLCVYDPQRIDPATQLPAQICGPSGDSAIFMLAPQSFSSLPAFGFAYGREYRWYVVAYGANGQYGYSFYERAITLLAAPKAPPTMSVTPSATPPAAASTPADWTLMVYAAGDNLLGDPQRATRSALLDNQLAQLRQLAASYPSLHLVTLSDAYGDTGAQLCYLPPSGGPDCQEQGEINTGDPATLGNFVKTALERYPASHRMLIIAGPGDPIGGLGRDVTTSGAPTIDIAGLRAAYVSAGLGASKRLDIVFYQVPLMGNVAVADATAPYAAYMVAAADQYWHLPIYDQILPLLSGAQKNQPAEVAKRLVAGYTTAVIGAGANLARSIAAYDMSQAATVVDMLNNLGIEITLALPGESTSLRAILRRVRQNAIAYDSSGNGLNNALEQASGEPLAIQEDALVDIRGVASALQAEPSISLELQSKASALASAISGGTSPLVLASSQVSGLGVAGRQVTLSGSSGLSAFFPTGVRLGGQPTIAQHYLYGASGEPRDGGWAGFLRAYLSLEVGRGPGGVTAGPSGGAQFRGPVGGMRNFNLLLPIVSR